MGDKCSCSSDIHQPESKVQPIYIRDTELLKLFTDEDLELKQWDERQQLEINFNVDSFSLAETPRLSHSQDEDAPVMHQLHEQSISEAQQLGKCHDPDVPIAQELNERHQQEINPDAKREDLAGIEQPAIKIHDHDVSMVQQPGEFKLLSWENADYKSSDLSEEKQLILRHSSLLGLQSMAAVWRRDFLGNIFLQRIMHIEAGANPDARLFSTGDTILHRVCKFNNLRCAEMLISVPSPYKVKNRARILDSLLHITELQMLPKVVAQLIVEYVAVPGADWTLKNWAGKTPLDLLESDWDVLQLQMDITKTLNRWSRGGEEELKLFLKIPTAKLTLGSAPCETSILPLLSLILVFFLIGFLRVPEMLHLHTWN